MPTDLDLIVPIVIVVLQFLGTFALGLFLGYAMGRRHKLMGVMEDVDAYGRIVDDERVPKV